MSLTEYPKERAFEKLKSFSKNIIGSTKIKLFSTLFLATLMQILPKESDAQQISFAPYGNQKTFACPNSSSARVSAVKIADIDNNGVNDFVVLGTGPLACSSSSYSQAYIFYQDTLPGFDTSYTTMPILGTGSNARDIEIADLDNNGLLDIVVPGNNNRVRILHQDSLGSFSNSPLLVSHPYKIEIEDMNGDNEKDIIIGHRTNSGTGKLSVAYKDTGNTFILQNEGTLPSIGMNQLDVLDINMNGTPDVIGSTEAGSSIGIYVFKDSLTNYSYTNYGNYLRTIASNNQNGEEIFIGRGIGGSGGFNYFTILQDTNIINDTIYNPYSHLGSSSEMYDFNCDGSTEILNFSDGFGSGPMISMYNFDSNGVSLKDTFSTNNWYANTHAYEESIDIGDINNDGKLDFAVAHDNYGVFVYINTTPDSLCSCPDIESLSIFLCYGGTYQGNIYNTDSILTNTIQNKNGCDSLIITTYINVLPEAVINLNDSTICYGEGGFTSNTSLSDTTLNQLGCDSIIDITNYSVLPNTQYDTSYSVLCNDNGLYSNDTAIVNVIPNQLGCDSVIHSLIINVLPNPTVNNRDTVVCYGDNGFTSNATLSDTILNRIGCDSIINTVNYSVLPQTFTNSNDITICYGENGLVSNTTLSDTTHNSLGCDSIINNTNYTVLPNTQYDTTYSILCSDNGIHTNDTSITTINPNQLGCDSIVYSLIINVLPQPIVSNIDTTVCYGENGFTSNITLSDTTHNSLGCDSLINNTNYTVLPEATVNINDTVINYGDGGHTNDTILTETILNDLGCDSIINQTNITINVDTLVDECEGILYPNPSNDKIYIDAKQGSNFKIYDARGRLVKEGKYNGYINIENISSAGYFIKYKCSNGDNVTKKFLKIGD